MKIALCYSGMFRDFTANIDNHIENIFADHNVDTYLSLWDVHGRGNFRTPLDINNLQKVTKKEKDTVVEKLQPKFIEYEKFLPISKKFLKYEKDNNVENQVPIIRNLLSMYYKIQKCGLVVQNSGIEYDIIVRLRTDLWFNEKLSFENFVNNKLFYNEGMHMSWSLGYDDKILYGDPYIMSKLNSLYDTIDSIWKKVQYYSAPEHLLYTFLQDNNIDVSPFNLYYKVV